MPEAAVSDLPFGCLEAVVDLPAVWLLVFSCSICRVAVWKVFMSCLLSVREWRLPAFNLLSSSMEAAVYYQLSCNGQMLLCPICRFATWRLERSTPCFPWMVANASYLHLLLLARNPLSPLDFGFHHYML